MSSILRKILDFLGLISVKIRKVDGAMAWAWSKVKVESIEEVMTE
ncbi:MAG: hypothetical protein WDZ35_10605 [Crocinitomicaceae bacterium]